MTALLYIFGAVSALIYLVFGHYMLTPKYKNVPTLLTLFGVAVLSVLLRILNEAFPAVFGIHSIICYGSYLAAFLFLYRDPLWKRLFVWFLTFLFPMIGELITYGIMELLFPGFMDGVSYYSYEQLIGTILASVIECLIYALFLPFWQRFMRHRRLTGFLPLFLLPAGQGIMFVTFVDMSHLVYNHIDFILVGIAELLLCAADIFWLNWIIGKAQRDELAQELQAAKNAEALQQKYFLDLERGNDRMAKLRHDYNNQLSAISLLIQSGKTDEASALTSELTARVSSTRTPVWCSHSVVNAVLASKLEACQEKGITPEFTISLPEDLPVTSLELSSVFSNLLDNAIHGAESSDSAEKYVRLTSKVKGGRLFIVTVNSSDEPKAPQDGHGLGTIILRTIAEGTGGSYISEYENGIFRATVALVLKEK